MPVGMNFKFRLPKPLGKTGVGSRVRKKAMMAVIEAMAAYLESVTQPAPEGVPVVSGQARGAFNKLARTLNMLAQVYHVQGVHFDEFGDGPHAKPEQNASLGSGMSKWTIQDRGDRRNIFITFVTEIPYFESREVGHEYRPWNSKHNGGEKGIAGRNQRDVPWLLMDQGADVFEEAWKIACRDTLGKLIKDWPSGRPIIVHGDKVSGLPKGKELVSDNEQEADVPF